MPMPPERLELPVVPAQAGTRRLAVRPKTLGARLRGHDGREQSRVLLSRDLRTLAIIAACAVPTR
jgi:hypothetical protein